MHRPWPTGHAEPYAQWPLALGLGSKSGIRLSITGIMATCKPE
jgi:hypothetical protein